MKASPILFVLSIICIIGAFFGNTGSLLEVLFQGGVKMIVGFCVMIAACALGRKRAAESQELHQKQQWER